MIGRALDWLRHARRKRILSADLVLGRRGEDVAHRYLRRHGYTIVARNYRLPSGSAEADLIALRKTALSSSSKSRLANRRPMAHRTARWGRKSSGT